MKYMSEYYVSVIGEQSNPNKDIEISKFYIGDNVSIYKEGVSAFTGTITLITSKGIYLDVGNKKDKYFRINEITKIY